jgi:hypothetical protein
VTVGVTGGVGDGVGVGVGSEPPHGLTDRHSIQVLKALFVNVGPPTSAPSIRV